jgi:hypothetical protein
VGGAKDQRRANLSRSGIYGSAAIRFCGNLPAREILDMGIGHTLVCNAVRPKGHRRKKKREKTMRDTQFVQFRIGATKAKKHQ